MLFEDVLGRTHRLPYEYFRHWDIFKANLREIFQHHIGWSLIEQNQFHVIDANWVK
ncbi:uncharacterized protein CC84DRAFT_1217008 [Paraphaeosphaeria sporulosa]|uniref:Ubiquitin-like domain-containing protein n=1 Tax=Paraphaeosphaeria sporulosa TaxID=1460663 RepID=A0A177CEP7_9PLEO|nr:uncharacterized protein CC84DRAFT_1217008 [Paraphaeosphaeria sporulosa]OAG05681.1 hypothetical protein CC84DRAFT_1217008 [Paraphaeosphaeria sporulosa]